jgi:fimbrial isopeptide formation D2 family protein
VSPAISAGSDPLSCSGGTIYQVQRGSGGNGILNAVAVGSMSGTNPVTATQVSTTIPNNMPNALGITAGGTAAWALAPQSPTVSGNTLTFSVRSYDAGTGTWTTQTATVDTTGKLPAGVTPASIANGGIVAGAIDPLSGNYYWAAYANAPVNAITIFGWNTTTNTSIGVVANSTLPEIIPNTSASTNGDLAFDRHGNLFVVSSVNTNAATGVIQGPLPTTPQTNPPTLPDTTLATYSNPNSNAYNGIAFDNSGGLYLEFSVSSSSTAILKIDPNTGAVLAGPATVNFTGSGGTIGVDLGACSVPPVMELQKNVINRQADTDQFNLKITGGGISSGNTATTTGTANGVQSATAGPVLGVTGTTYTFAETGAGTTTMANYTTTWQCIDEGQGNLVIASGTGQSFPLTLPAPAPTETGQFVVCTFTNSAPRLVVSKTAVPSSGSFVNPGQSVTYTLTFDNSGGGQPAAVNHTDDLTKVLDDATVTTPPALATGSGLTVSAISGGKFTVTGTLAARATATVTFTVTVNNPDTSGDHELVNFVVPTGTTPPPTCTPTTPPTCTIHFVAQTPGFTTTIVPPSATAVGNTWGDTAKVAGNSDGGPPTGTVSWTFCKESAPPTACTGGTAIGSTSTSTMSGNDSTFTLPAPQTPTAVGTYCFNASFTATGGHYLNVAQQTGTECFTVTPAASTSKTTASPSSVVIGPTGTATDTITVTGNPTGGAPTGTVAFTVCGPLPGTALCPSGTAVPPTATLSSTGATTSSATSGTFTPTSAGTWCFAAVYTPASGSNYTGSSDNVTGTADPAECFTVTPATPGFTTTILPPTATSVGNTWGDTATVAGNSAGGPPTGTVSWTLCKESAPPTACTGGTAIGSTGTSTPSGNNSTFTLPNPQTPTAVGTYCFNASYTATPNGNYTSVSQQTGTECFTVIPATSSSATTASPTSVVIGPTGTATDSVTVTGNATGGAPTGTVAFTVCGPLTGAALCPSGTPVNSVALTPGSGITSTATSGTFTPTSVGTWCFAAVYTPATGSNYTGSSDNLTGTAVPAECFSVTPATPGLITTIVPPSNTAVGNTWGDTATVTGNSAGGAPRGTVSWTLCQESAPPTPCTGGTGIGSDNSPTPSGNNSTYTLPNPQTPKAVGTYCFNASYAAAPNGNYASVSQQIGAECFTVTTATSSSTTTASPSSVVIGPTGTATDSVTVTGNPTGGAPTGTVAFTVCGPLPGAALCPSGTPVNSVALTPGSGFTSSAISGTFTPNAAGTWCFAAVYTPASGSNYTGSSDNVAGTASSAECFTAIAVTTGLTTTILPPAATSVGNTWGDTATALGTTPPGPPAGTVSWTICQESTPPTPCTGGNPIGSTSTSTPSGGNSIFTLPNPQTPRAVGTYCFNASFASSNGNYTSVPQQDGTECFTVTPAASTSATTASPSSVVIGPTGTATDSVTVTGNATGGTPTGTVDFTVCGPSPGPALCPSGTPVPPASVILGSTGTETSGATSGSFTPTSVGTWCFAAVYTPGSGSNYTGSSDNISGTPDGAECFTVTPATPGFTTTVLPPTDTSVGTPWGDTATVAGNSSGGAPRGTVTWTLCQETAPPTACTGGTSIGSDNTPTQTGNDSTFTLPDPQVPKVGTWCFNASYTPSTGGNYTAVSQQTGDECFTVTPATSSSATTASPTSVVIGPTGTATDAVTVTGNATGGAPTGTVAFTVCGPLTGAALCPSGTPVNSVALTPGSGITSTATSGTFTPTSVGTWCFAAVYTPASGSNYQGSSDNISGTPSSAECFTVTPATPGFTTTIQPPDDTSVGNTWGDTATVAGNSAGGPPTGTVSWTLCPETVLRTPCSGGVDIGSTGTSTPSGNNSTFTLPNPQTPIAVGTYCFNASYAATPNGNYTSVSQQTGTECFTVTPATSSSATTASPTSVVIGPTGTATDSVTVTGNATGGAPTGTVAFTVCGPLPGAALCPGGTPVPPASVILSPTGADTSGATSGTLTPTSVGTWCFAAVYTPATGSNYTGSSDNVTGTVSSAECFTVTPATPGFTTTIVPPPDTAVGNTWGDTATVAGNSAGGPPTGTVSWTLCQESAPPTTCTGGTAIGSTGTSTPSGNNSTFTLPNPQTPTAVGTWCFNASYAATPGGNYSDVAQQTGDECFAVTPATSSSTTTASPGSVVIGPTGTATDSVTVTGNPAGGPPDGTVAFTVCGPLPGPALCTGGTAVPPDQTLAATGTDTSGTTSDAFRPPSVGTWCFAAVYTPANGSNYTGSSDNLTGTANPAECFSVTPATPGFTTTVQPPDDTSVGNTWGDTATVAGNSAGGPPTGTVSWTLCQESTPGTPCTGGDDIGSTSTSTPNLLDSIFTLPTPQSPTAVGTWCFNASYAATPGGNYSDVAQQTGDECFAVTPATSSSTTTASPTSVVIGPTGTVTDSVTVTGNPTGGAPIGTVDFTVCGPTAGPALCPSDSSTPMPVPPASVTLAPSGADTSSAASGTFTPTSLGTWCFAAVYTPATGSNYLGSSDNVTGTVSSAECFSVGTATPGFTTTIVPPTATTGGTWGDTATVAGNSVGGPPAGTVSWTLCQERAPATPCTGGTGIGSTGTSTVSGNNSTFTLPTPQTPAAGGTYCFNASFVAMPGGNYSDVSQQSGTECFTVNFTVTKTVAGGNGSRVNPGAVVTYTIAVQNLGDGIGTAVVTDTVPSQLTLTKAPTCAVTTPDVCTVANPTGSTWTFSVTLAPNHTATATLSATVAASATGSILNTATITDGPCIASDACTSSVSNPIATVADAVVSPITPTKIPVTG